MIMAYHNHSHWQPRTLSPAATVIVTRPPRHPGSGSRPAGGCGFASPGSELTASGPGSESLKLSVDRDSESLQLSVDSDVK